MFVIRRNTISTLGEAGYFYFVPFTTRICLKKLINGSSFHMAFAMHLAECTANARET